MSHRRGGQVRRRWTDATGPCRCHASLIRDMRRSSLHRRRRRWFPRCHRLGLSALRPNCSQRQIPRLPTRLPRLLRASRRPVSAPVLSPCRASQRMLHISSQRFASDSLTRQFLRRFDRDSIAIRNMMISSGFCARQRRSSWLGNRSGRQRSAQQRAHTVRRRDCAMHGGCHFGPRCHQRPAPWSRRHPVREHNDPTRCTRSQ